MAIRFPILIIGIILSYLFLVFRLYELQVVKGEYYLARAESKYLPSEFLNANRGIIYFTDKNGNRLAAAVNKSFPVIYAVPKIIDDFAEASRRLAAVLNQSPENLEKKLSNKNDAYRPLLKKADSDIVAQVGALGIKGVYVDMIPGRFYPQGDVGANLLGFVGPDEDGTRDVGHYGLEEFFNEQLVGRSGTISSGNIVKSEEGKDLILTIDPNIQVQAEMVLGKIVKEYEARGGTVIVGEPQTGKILAMGGLPNFDPNVYGQSPIANFLNPAVQKIYEPGSVFKVITMAIGIDSGKITPDTTYVDKGSITLNGRTISNWDLKERGPYGRVSMTNVIERSINTGAVFAQQQIGRDIFAQYVKKFGPGDKTGITVPGELKGNISRLNPKERDIAFATASYGQGVAITPIELWVAISAIANGGNLMKPYINAALGPEVIRRVISKDAAQKVAAMMVSAVDKAEVAKIEGYTIAGKTGTAFVPNFEEGGYTDKVINTYVGFGPASNPKFLILIKMDEPVGAPLAGTSVVPAFRELAQFLLNYYNIPPDRI